jgi:hypothetical protein
MSSSFGFSNIVIPVTGLTYKGLWDANSNTPTLQSSVGNSGDYYIVAVAGTTDLNGITDWQVNDWVIFNGGVWQKIDNSDTGLVPYVGATLDVDLGTHSLLTESVKINTIPTTYTPAVGVLGWNDTDGTLEFGLKGGNAILQIGQENIVRVTNDDTVTLTSGMVVYVSGANGSNLLVKRAQANTEATSAGTLGVVTETINTNNQGFITTFGIVRGLNTNAFNNGDTLYLSPSVAGGLTNTKPIAPDNLVTVAFVVKKSSGNGEIFVRIDNGYELDELHNVYINPITLANGDVLTYNSATQLWENKALVVASGVWGISNVSGVYTYYATLTLAMAAATAGQTIEMFADVIATSVVTIKPDVIIQGNGHTYTYSGNTGDVFATSAGAGIFTYYFNNLTIKRANTATSTGVIFSGNGTAFTTGINFKFNSVYISYTTTTGIASIITTTGFGVYGWSFDGVDVIGNSSGYLFGTAFAVSNIKNSRIENTGTGGCIATPNITGGCSYENCYIKTNSGTGIFCNYASDVIRNCTGISSTGTAFAGQSGASVYDSFAFSNTSIAFNGLNCYNCTGQTTTGNAFYGSSYSAYNCTGRSTTGFTIRPFSGMSNFYNSSFYSSGSITVYDVDFGASFYNCSIITDYNNVAGHAVSIGPSSGNPAFVNNYIQVANASANCIRGTNAFSAAITGNAYKSATTPVNANVTQTITNTKDNQGNILI